MTRLVQKFLQDEERSRNMIGTAGIVAGIILLTLSILNTFFAR